MTNCTSRRALALLLFFLVSLTSGTCLANDWVFEDTVFFTAQSYAIGFDVDDTRKEAESDALLDALGSLDDFLYENPTFAVVDIKIDYDNFYADDGVHVIVVAYVMVKMTYDKDTDSGKLQSRQPATMDKGKSAPAGKASPTEKRTADNWP